MDYRDRIADERVSIQGLLDGHQAGIWTAMPALVAEVHLDKVTFTLQPAIQARELAPDGTKSDVSMPQLVDVPICWPHGGGYSITFPHAAGDEVLAVFASRCIDNWWAHGGEQPQFEQRHHDLSDSIAIPGPYSQAKKIADVSSATAQFRSDDGTLFVEVDLPHKKVRIVSNDDLIDVDSASHVITITAADQVTVNSPLVLVNGDLRATGAITAGYGGGDQVGVQTHLHNQGADAHGDAELPTQAPTPGT